MIRKKNFLLLLLSSLLCCSNMLGQNSFQFDGLNYNILNESEVEVGMSQDQDPYSQSDIIIPAIVENENHKYTVVRIGEQAFQHFGQEAMGYTKCVQIPSSVKTIGRDAFAGSYFYGIEIPEGVERIEDGAFSSCSIRSFVLPKSLKYIGWNAFGYFGPMGTHMITILNTHIGMSNLHFYVGGFFDEFTGEQILGQWTYEVDNPDLLSVDQDGVILFTGKEGTAIISVKSEDKIIHKLGIRCGISTPSNLIYESRSNNEASVIGCSSEELSNIIVIPSYTYINGYKCDVTSIDSYAFKNKDIKRVILPENISVINNEAFRNCGYLSGINFPKKLVSIGTRAFQDCKRLNNITFPANLEFIGETAFAGCSSLSEAVLHEGLKTLGSRAFNGCSALKKIYIPTTTSFAVGMYENFEGVESLKSITFQNIEEAYKYRVPVPLNGIDPSTAKITSSHPNVVNIERNYLQFKKNGRSTITIEGTDLQNNHKISTCDVILGGYPIKISSSGYATFSAPADYIVPNEIQANSVKVESGVAYISNTGTRHFFPKEDGVLLKGEPGEYFVRVFGHKDPNNNKLPNNDLKPSYTDEVIKAGRGNKLFVFAKGQHGLGFYYQKGCPNGSQVSNLAGKAYLEVPVEMVSGANGLRIVENEVSGIEKVDTDNINVSIYTLTGIKLNKTVDQLTNGIYIVNGKKIIVK